MHLSEDLLSISTCSFPNSDRSQLSHRMPRSPKKPSTTDSRRMLSTPQFPAESRLLRHGTAWSRSITNLTRRKIGFALVLKLTLEFPSKDTGLVSIALNLTRPDQEQREIKCDISRFGPAVVHRPPLLLFGTLSRPLRISHTASLVAQKWTSTLTGLISNGRVNNSTHSHDPRASK